MELVFLWNEQPEWWRFVGLYATWVISFCLPYGERTPYWAKTLVGCSFSLPLLFIGINPWMSVVPVVFILMFFASNKGGFLSSAFVWKIVEMSIGFTIGIATAFFCKSNEWIMIACGATGMIGFAVGGTGPKYVRRFIMPFVLTSLLFFVLR